jgi:hypothetical protein
MFALASEPSKDHPVWLDDVIATAEHPQVPATHTMSPVTGDSRQRAVDVRKSSLFGQQVRGLLKVSDPVAGKNTPITQHCLCLRNAASGRRSLPVRDLPQGAGVTVLLQQRRQGQRICWQMHGRPNEGRAVAVRGGDPTNQWYYHGVVNGSEGPHSVEHAVRQASPALLPGLRVKKRHGIDHRAANHVFPVRVQHLQSVGSSSAATDRASLPTNSSVHSHRDRTHCQSCRTA